MQQNKAFTRSARVAEAIHKELAKIIVKVCRNPLLDEITITNVILSKDLSIAKIYFVDFILDRNAAGLSKSAPIKINQTLNALNKSSVFLRYQLAQKLSFLRKIPELRFFYDENIVYGIKMDLLFAKIGLL